jgi:hypothetical protein
MFLKYYPFKKHAFFFTTHFKKTCVIFTTHLKICVLVTTHFKNMSSFHYPFKKHAFFCATLYIKRKINWIGHILRRNCLLLQVIEGKIKGEIEVTGRRGRRLRKLPDDLRERRGYLHLKEETLDRTMWTACFGRCFGPVVRQTAK